MTHPIPYIKEIQHIKSINNINDLISLNQITFSLIPWSMNRAGIHNNLKQFYELFKQSKGAWCLENAQFLSLIYKCFGLNTSIYHYGDEEPILHTVTIVKFKNRQYLMDPYFGCHYADSNGHLLTFATLKTNIQKKDFKNVVPTFSKLTKKVFYHQKWQAWSPQKLLGAIINSWKVLNNLDNKLIKKYGTTNPIVLIPQCYSMETT